MLKRVVLLLCSLSLSLAWAGKPGHGLDAHLHIETLADQHYQISVTIDSLIARESLQLELQFPQWPEADPAGYSWQGSVAAGHNSELWQLALNSQTPPSQVQLTLTFQSESGQTLTLTRGLDWPSPTIVTRQRSRHSSVLNDYAIIPLRPQ